MCELKSFHSLHTPVTGKARRPTAESLRLTAGTDKTIGGRGPKLSRQLTFITALITTRNLCYRKDDCAMRPTYSGLKNYPGYNFFLPAKSLTTIL